MNGQTPTTDVRIIQGVWRRVGGLRGGILVLIAIVVIVTMIRGIYTIPTNSAGAQQFMGKVVQEDIGAGIHFKLPSPIHRVTVQSTSEIRRMNLAGLSRRGIVLLTGDENIIELKAGLQFKIHGLRSYLFRCEDWEALMEVAAESALAEVVAGLSVDEVLTTGKARIQSFVRGRVQELMDRYDSGISIVAISIQTIVPPSEAAASFRQVSDAKSEMARRISEAQTKRNKDLSLARGKAEQILRNAESSANERTKRASSDTRRTLKILAEYERTREITETELYLEAMERLLSRVKKVILNPDAQERLDLNLFGGKQ